MEEKYISVAELAKLLGISRIAVFKKIKSGKIKAIKIGRNYAIPKKSFDVILGRSLSEGDKKEIDTAVKKTVLEYGETLRLLGND